MKFFILFFFIIFVQSTLYSPHPSLSKQETTLCSEKYNISREQQDEYAILSIKRAHEAENKGFLKKEIVPITVRTNKETKTITKDDELQKKPNFEKLKQLSPAFKKNGTVTAANASIIADGASCLILVSGKYAKQHHLNVLGFIRSFDDASQEPMMFTTSPSIAVKKTLQKSNLMIKDIDFFVSFIFLFQENK